MVLSARTVSVLTVTPRVCLDAWWKCSAGHHAYRESERDQRGADPWQPAEPGDGQERCPDRRSARDPGVGAGIDPGARELRADRMGTHGTGLVDRRHPAECA